MRKLPDQTPPLLYGPDEVTEGYYELQASEHSNTQYALDEQREAVGLWYRILTLYRRGMMGRWDRPEANPSKEAVTIWGLQGQLLGLGVSSAKASLDMLLAGYYSMAYAGIRHMLETFVQCLYVEVRPDEAKRWVRQPGELAAQAKTPRCIEMIDAVKKRPDAVESDLMDKIYAAWHLISKGSHPTGQGITQTIGEAKVHFIFGATYDANLCVTGFDHGLFAILMLVNALSVVQPQADLWRTELATLWIAYETWQTEHAASVAAEEATAA